MDHWLRDGWRPNKTKGPSERNDKWRRMTSPDVRNGYRRGSQMENWKMRAGEGAWMSAGPGKNAPDTSRDPGPASRRGGTRRQSPSHQPACRPHSRAPHRVVELGDGRHDSVIVLAPVHFRAASPQLVPPVRGAHGRSGAWEQLLLGRRKAQT